ncbi:MAG TPA: DUF4405 domain-containing protein [Candidatus Merdivicinus intestinigallinarum]|nr:DUF4405 domain-containing protein [Candidatus Merdivicinus intestinigallinarum]
MTNRKDQRRSRHPLKRRLLLPLLLLMAKQLTGDPAHEWLGAGMFALWILHHAFNFQWHSRIHKGNYPSFRIAQLVVNILLFLSMIGTMVSAVILSREVFAFLPISGGIAFARSLHVFCTFWCFVLTALHLGLHWNMVLGIIRKGAGPVQSKPVQTLLRLAGAAIAVYGLYAFLKNQFPSYLFLTSTFVFFDFERPPVLFFVEYTAILGMLVFLAYYGTKGLQYLKKKKAAGKS